MNDRKEAEKDQGKGTLFRNIQDTGRLNYSASGSRQTGSYLLDGFLLIKFWNKDLYTSPKENCLELKRFP